jgi:hypothetical protein
LSEINYCYVTCATNVTVGQTKSNKSKRKEHRTEKIACRTQDITQKDGTQKVDSM